MTCAIKVKDDDVNTAHRAITVDTVSSPAVFKANQRFDAPVSEPLNAYCNAPLYSYCQSFFVSPTLNTSSIISLANSSDSFPIEMQKLESPSGKFFSFLTEVKVSEQILKKSEKRASIFSRFFKAKPAASTWQRKPGNSDADFLNIIKMIYEKSYESRNISKDNDAKDKLLAKTIALKNEVINLATVLFKGSRNMTPLEKKSIENYFEKHSVKIPFQE